MGSLLACSSVIVNPLCYGPRQTARPGRAHAHWDHPGKRRAGCGTLSPIPNWREVNCGGREECELVG